MSNYTPTRSVFAWGRPFLKFNIHLPFIKLVEVDQEGNEMTLTECQIFRALAYIHAIGVCHRDIKPQNLLVCIQNSSLACVPALVSSFVVTM